MSDMSQSIINSPRTSEEEYLRMEDAAKTRHEFRDGEVIDMAGGTEQHAAIAANLISELRARLRGKPYGSDLRLHITGSGDYAFPAEITAGRILTHSNLGANNTGQR